MNANQAKVLAHNLSAEKKIVFVVDFSGEFGGGSGLDHNRVAVYQPSKNQAGWRSDACEVVETVLRSCAYDCAIFVECGRFADAARTVKTTTAILD